MLEKPIIILGAGPVGLTAAILLSQQGIPVEVLEKGDGPSKEWRASTFHSFLFTQEQLNTLKT